jgi:RhtB (resistance to homoserine/threonine) family protein
MEYDSSLFAVALVSLAAAISPGPDFFIVLKNSLSFSRKAGFFTAIGISIALIIHLTYTLMGIGLVLAESPFLFMIIKYIGVGYLFYIGISSIKDSFKKKPSMDVNYPKSDYQISSNKAFLQGFLTNMLNPKAAFFFISLFSQFIDPSTPILLRIEYAIINWSVTLGWFLFLSYLVTAKMFLNKINQFRIYIDRIMGGVLLILGIRLLLV